MPMIALTNAEWVRSNWDTTWDKADNHSRSCDGEMLEFPCASGGPTVANWPTSSLNGSGTPYGEQFEKARQVAK